MRNPKDFNLLIVDDEDGIRDTLALYFRMDGYNIFTASGGNKAIEIIKENKIDFIISDMKMADGDGEMLLGKINEMNPESPAVLMVSGFSHLTREKVIAKGAIDLLEKPIDLDLIEKYISERLIG